MKPHQYIRPAFPITQYDFIRYPIPQNLHDRPNLPAAQFIVRQSLGTH